MKLYNKENISLARKLRKNMTPWERKLWYEYLRYYPVRFQRQKAIGNYIVDFYCAKARLIIELDGGGHYEPAQATADAARTKELENMKLSVLRICNLDIDKNFSGVCEYIDMAVQKALPRSAALTAPSTEGALRCGQEKTIYALGFFDGVHLGHQALLKSCRELARENGCKAGVITFAVHPEAVVSDSAPLLLNSVPDRRQLLYAFGADTVMELPFDKAMMTTHWSSFLEQLTQAGAAGFVCGSDFRFGAGGSGTAKKLAAFCEKRHLLYKIVPQQYLEDVRISSTYVRQLLEAGQMEQAVKFLGHPHILSGAVVSGRKLGHTIGVPTANLQLPEGVMLPQRGVYACAAMTDKKVYLAVTNIGSRPTVGGHHVTVEPWLLDFDGDLYGKQLTLAFFAFLRPEKKFESLDRLKEQIQMDAAQTRTLLENLFSGNENFPLQLGKLMI